MKLVEKFCGEANKHYRCVTCDEPCGSEGHFITVKESFIPDKIIERYEYLLLGMEDKKDYPNKTGRAHLYWMLKELSLGEFDEGKANRWLGFIQGILIARGITTVDEERDFTRPFFSKKKDLYYYKDKPYSFFANSKLKKNGIWADVVIYKSEYENPEGEYWVRFADEFDYLFKLKI